MWGRGGPYFIIIKQFKKVWIIQVHEFFLYIYIYFLILFCMQKKEEVDWNINNHLLIGVNFDLLQPCTRTWLSKQIELHLADAQVFEQS